MDYDELMDVHEEALWFNEEINPNDGWFYTIDEIQAIAVLENTTFPNDLDFEFPLETSEEDYPEIYPELDNFEFRLPSGCHIISKEEIQESINRKDKKQNTRAI